jgi:hypothetical protein
MFGSVVPGIVSAFGGSIPPAVLQWGETLILGLVVGDTVAQIHAQSVTANLTAAQNSAQAAK